MLPIQLKLKGIYSYQDEQVINFEQLIQDNLFGIFGEVGSGKSTILEAMTLALYDETERLGKKDNRRYNLMNLQSKELSVDFEFKAGKEQKRYRFTVKGKRNSKKFKEVKSFSHDRYVWDEQKNDWLPIEETASNIINLSYENFKRTIIIPQGKFQDFLQLKDAKRAEMMEEIFQLERFNLQGNVNKLKKQNETDLTLLDGKISGMEEVSKEILKEKKTHLKSLSKEITAEHKAFDKQQTQLQAMNNLQADFIAWEKKKESLEKLSEQKATYKTRTEHLEKCTRCQTIFRNIVEEREVVRNAVIKLKKGHQQLKQEEESILIAVKEKEKIFTNLKNKYSSIEVLDGKIKNLDLVMRMVQIQTSTESKGKQLLELQKNLEKEEQTVLQLTKQLQEKKQELTLLDSRQDFNNLLEMMEERNQEIEDEINKSETKKKTAEDSIQQQLGKNWDSEKLLNELLVEPNETKKKAFWDLQKKVQIIAGQETLLVYLLKTHTLYSDQLLALKNSIQENQFQNNNIAQGDVEKNLQQFAQKLKKEIKTLEQSLASKGIEKNKAKISELSQNIQAEKGEYNSLNIQFEGIDISGLLTKSVDEIKKIKDYHQQLRSDYANKDKEINELQERVKQKQTLLEDRQKQLEKNQKDLDIVNKKIEKKIRDNGYESMEIVMELALISLDQIMKEKNAIAAFNEKISNEEALIKELNTKLKDKKYDKQLHAELKSTFSTLQQALEAKKKSQNVLEEEIIRLSKTLEDKKKLIEDKKKLEVRQTNIAVLEKMFRAKGFVNYVSGIKLKDLCNAANDRFRRMTKNHLSLELNEKNNFRIRDYMNGGEVRSITTLSGGQTFQAALSLAIALADIVNQSKGQQADFFFLDEGFGSLDKASLQIVFETLQTLRKENKIVGVISHVEDLQEEIGTFLKVKNSEAGSRVIGSWEY